MRPIAIIVAAALVAAAPLMASAAPDGRGGGHSRGEDRGEGRGGYAPRGGGGYAAPRGYAPPSRGAPPGYGRGYPVPEAPPGYGRGYPMPPSAYRAPAPSEPSYRQGQYLPPEYRGSVVQDLGRYRLRTPPPGYAWVGVGPDIYLMQRSTGMVLDIIPRGY